MNATILILTRDRLPKLLRCLERLLPQLAEGDEALVVDTGSKDGTPEAFEREPPPGVRLVRFTGSGSWAEARNFAVDLARGEHLAFLDDDCYAAPDWIARGKAALAECDAAGGFVEPLASLVFLDWWIPEMGWLAGLSVPGHRTHEAGSVYYPFTANLWVRAEAARRERFQELGGEFSQREADRYATGREDAEWWRRLRLKGYRTRFDPEMRVEHDIPAERLNLEYLRERARRDGGAWARREGRPEDLEEIAYRWWMHAAPDPEERGISDTRRSGLRRLHEFMKGRQHEALVELTRKIAEENPHGDHATALRVKALMHAGFRRLRDRAKTTARRIALAYDPPMKYPAPSAAPARVAVAAFGFLGDMVILQSCIKGALKAHPGASIHLLAPLAAVDIFRDVARVEVSALPVVDPGASEVRGFLERWLAEKQPELIVAPYLHGHWGTALVRLKRLRIPLIGFEDEEALARKIDRERIPLRVARIPGEHESRDLMRLFEFARLGGEPEPATLQATDDARRWARAWRKGLPRDLQPLPVLMLNPEAAQSCKEWPEESWVETIRLLLDELPHVFAVNLNRVNAPFEERFATLAKRERVRFLRVTPLDHLIGLMAASEGIITVDAGPQHLAHALSIPSLTLYGPRDERRWGDAWERPIHEVLRAGDWDLTPEETRGLPENHLMRLITPAAVVTKVREWKRNLKSLNPGI